MCRNRLHLGDSVPLLAGAPAGVSRPVYMPDLREGESRTSVNQPAVNEELVITEQIGAEAARRVDEAATALEVEVRPLNEGDEAAPSTSSRWVSLEFIPIVLSCIAGIHV